MIVLLFSGLMSCIHFFSEDISLKYIKHKDKIQSFAAGISITYLFLSLFPEFSVAAKAANKMLFLTVLLGFVIFHIIEKTIYQRTPESKVRGELAIEDSIISFIYHFIIGIIMVHFFEVGLTQGILFFIPVFFFTTVSTLPIDMTTSKLLKFGVAVSTFLGSMFGLNVVPLPPMIYLSLLGFVVGVMTFTVTRHSIPTGRHGKPEYFALGVLLYSLVILFP